MPESTATDDSTSVITLPNLSIREKKPLDALRWAFREDPRLVGLISRIGPTRVVFTRDIPRILEILAELGM